MMRCCGRISCFRILHLLSPKTGTTKKSSWCQRRTSILSPLYPNKPECLFCDEFTVVRSHNSYTVKRSARRSSILYQITRAAEFVKTRHDPENACSHAKRNARICRRVSQVDAFQRFTISPRQSARHGCDILRPSSSPRLIPESP